MAPSSGGPAQNGRFKPGQSGNPKGRPKGATGLRKILRDELGQRVAVSEGGRTFKATKLQVVVKRLVERASKGDPRAVAQLIELTVRTFGLDGEAPRTIAVTSEDQAIIDAYIVRRAVGTDFDRGSDADHGVETSIETS